MSDTIPRFSAALFEAREELRAKLDREAVRRQWCDYLHGPLRERLSEILEVAKPTLADMAVQM
ncbi:hypothetical protein [Roseococcus sp. YIM B11640]|uniref:hypothetical protein n=1 Tax=Roseococcus sp. YIM B11640 TaxID=3133973 RepID=UPI003C7E529F